MHSPSKPAGAEVFVSYARRDRDRVMQVVEALVAAGVPVWRDQDDILGGECYGPKIVHGIKHCKVLLLFCSDASMRSRNVKQEIQLAWQHGRPYLPLLLEPMNQYPEQVQYWLEGWQWIEVLARPPEQWLLAVLQALANAGVSCPGEASLPAQPDVKPIPPTRGFEGLRALARFTDQIWPVPADRARRGDTRAGLRDLGAPQEDVRHGHPLGSRVRLAIESDRPGHLLLLDEGTSGKIYCLCPSLFAPDTRLQAGRTYLPQPGARHDAFVVSGKPGREHLLAILTDEPLELQWMSDDPKVPARLLSPADLDLVLARLRDLEGDRWTTLATYFEVMA